MRQVNFLPSLITAFGLACGLFVVFKVNLAPGGQDLYELLYKSSLILILAAIADVLDGAVARIIKAESNFGIFFDSMADAISFGVAPSALLLKSMDLEPGTGLSFYAILGAILFSLCGIFRLVRFSVSVGKPKKGEKQKHFVGLPIPAAAGASVSAILFFHSPQFKQWFGLDDTTTAIALSSIMIVLGYLMISKLKFLSVKGLKFRVPSFPLLLLTAIIAIFLLFGFLYHFALTIFTFAWVYLIICLILTLIRLIAGKKSKTLKDFDPDD